MMISVSSELELIMQYNPVPQKIKLMNMKYKTRIRKSLTTLYLFLLCEHVIVTFMNQSNGWILAMSFCSPFRCQHRCLP